MQRAITALIATALGLFFLLSFKAQVPQLAVAGTTGRQADDADTAAAKRRTASNGKATTPARNGSKAKPGTALPRPRNTATATAKARPSAAAVQEVETLGDAVGTEYGTVQVRVVTQGTKILRVEPVQMPSGGRSAQLSAAAGPALGEAVLAAQSADVDTVSGATYTSDGYLTSLQSALDRA